MKISDKVTLGLILSSLLAGGVFADDTAKKNEDRKPASACVISTTRSAIVVSGTCAEEIGDELTNKNLSNATISCRKSNCSITGTGGNSGGGGTGGGDAGAAGGAR